VITRGSHRFTCHPHTNNCLYFPAAQHYFISVYCFYCMLCMLSAFGANKLHHYRPLAGTQLRLPTEGWPGWVDLGGWKRFTNEWLIIRRSSSSSSWSLSLTLMLFSLSTSYERVIIVVMATQCRCCSSRDAVMSSKKARRCRTPTDVQYVTCHRIL